MQQELTKVLRRFGRRGRGPGHVCVTLVRHPERPLLTLGEPITHFAHKAPAHLAQTTALGEAKRARRSRQLPTATRAQAHMRQQSTRLTPGKKLSHGKLGKAYAPTMAPISKGKSHGQAQLGSKPGLASAPAPGVICATLVPPGNPRDASSG